MDGEWCFTCQTWWFSSLIRNRFPEGTILHSANSILVVSIIWKLTRPCPGQQFWLDASVIKSVCRLENYWKGVLPLKFHRVRCSIHWQGVPFLIPSPFWLLFFVTWVATFSKTATIFFSVSECHSPILWPSLVAGHSYGNVMIDRWIWGVTLPNSTRWCPLQLIIG